ncbi:alpha/beta hydrolase family protein [Archangium violaceum]|uniref:alpha/beta hydrolase family protein n=1 Tax=Archangium violaceum TaxID=83451 RepID=UPI003D268C76
MLSGSGANDRDETVCGHKPFRILASFFARHGYAVQRYDTRGSVGSSGNADRTTFSDSVADATAAFRALALTTGIDQNRICFCGHSEGGLVAATAAPNLPVHAVIMLAGPAMPIELPLNGQARAISLEAAARGRQPRGLRPLSCPRRQGEWRVARPRRPHRRRAPRPHFISR